MNDDLAGRYDAIDYGSKPVPLSHAAHLATVATLFGIEPPDAASCRVLELGCGDAANLIAMAVTLPNATLTGIELAARPVEQARRAIDELKLRNIEVMQGDLSTFGKAGEKFDYIVAHGVYSWVPSPVRDALFALGARLLSPSGVMFVSYNTLPGCHVRRVGWDILRFHTQGIADPKARIDAARAFCGMLAEPSAASEGTNALLRHEFSRLTEMPDGAIFHDDLADPNDPVYFHQFMSHAKQHGLVFLAESAVSSMSGAGLAPRVRQMLVTLDPETREQYVDFARFRRFRQTLLCRGDGVKIQGLAATRIAGMHASATLALTRAAAEKQPIGASPSGDGGDPSQTMRALLQWIVDVSPQAVSVDEARNWLRKHTATAKPAGGRDRSIEELLLEAYISGTVQLHARPLPLTTVIDERPVASPLARRQAQHGEQLTNLRHDLVRIDDSIARQVLRMLDGSRNRAQLIDALSVTLPPAERTTAPSRVDFYLQNFAKVALLMRT